MSAVQPLEPQAMSLNRIDQLIKDGRYDEARRALRHVLSRDAHNAAGWWRYAKVAPDLAEACTAVTNVLAIEPEFPRAREALAILKRRLAEGPQDGAPPAPTDRPRRDQIESLIGLALLVAALVLVAGAALHTISSSLSGAPAAAPADVKQRPLIVYVYADW